MPLRVGLKQRCGADGRGSYCRMASGICSRSVGMNCESFCRLWMKVIFLLNLSLWTAGGGVSGETVRQQNTVWGVLSECAADLMKGLTRVSRALMYQAGWTTRSPFRSFFNLNTHRDTNITRVVMVTRSLLWLFCGSGNRKQLGPIRILPLQPLLPHRWWGYLESRLVFFKAEP